VLSYGWSLFIVGIAALIVLRFAWAPMVMAFVLAGVTSPTTMLGAIIGLAILMAASLHAKLNGRPF
jgi:zinc transporter ZupT